MLLAFLNTDLYEREGQAVTNFNSTLPEGFQEQPALYQGTGRGIKGMTYKSLLFPLGTEVA